MFTRMARRLRQADNERGISLIELLVTIAIFSLIMVLISGFYVSAMKTVALSRGLTMNTKTVSNAMSAISRAIRAGTNNPEPGNIIDPAFLVASNDEVVFYAYVNLAEVVETPVMYRFRVDRTTGELTEEQWPATRDMANDLWTFPDPSAAPAYRRVIAETIAPYDSGNHPFTFVGPNGEELNPGVGNLASTDREKVIAVKLTLTVQDSLADDRYPVTLVNLVGMPNLGFSKEDED